MRLTKKIVESATYEGNGGSRYVLWDEEVRGLGLRVFPSGRKSFVLLYRVDGRQRLMKLGSYGVFTVQDARKKAKALLYNVELHQEDPLAVRRARSKVRTVIEVAQRYLKEHAEVKKKSASVKNDEQMLRDYVLPGIGRMRIEAVSRADIAAVHHSLRDKPYAANRVLALLSKLFGLCEAWGLRADNSNPCRHVERFKEKRRERYLSQQELRRLVDVLDEVEEEESESLFAVAAIRLLLWTGCRRNEILHLRWRDVDLDAGVLRLSDSKTGSKTVYLGPAAIALLTDLPRAASNPWVIQGRKENSHFTAIARPWNRIRARAGLDDVRLHDLRHTFAAFGAASGLSLPMIGKLLGHTQPATTQRYAHLAADPMHDAAGRIGAAMEAAIGGEGAAPVAES